MMAWVEAHSLKHCIMYHHHLISIKTLFLLPWHIVLLFSLHSHGCSQGANICPIVLVPYLHVEHLLWCTPFPLKDIQPLLLLTVRVSAMDRLWQVSARQLRDDPY